MDNNSVFQQSVNSMREQGYVIPQDRVNTIEKFSSNRGVKVLFDNTLNDINGVYDSATRTYKINPNSSRPIEFIAVHEMLHDIQNSPEYAELRKFVEEYAKGTGNYAQAIKSLENTYRSYYEKNNLNQDNLDIGVEATNDMVAQALGNQEFLNSLLQTKPSVFTRMYNWIKEMGTKIFGTEEDKFLLDLKKKFEKAYNSAYQKGNNKGDISYLVKNGINNKPIVIIEDDILANVPKNNWVKVIKDTLKNKYPNGIDMNYFNIGLNAKTRNEYTNSSYTKEIRVKQKDIYEAKMKMANNIDEIVQNAYNVKNELPKHKRNDGFKSFNRSNIDVMIGSNVYTIDVVTGINGKNNELLYDIVDIKKKTSPISYSTNVVAKNGTSSSINNSIQQNDTTVNSYSMQKTENNALGLENSSSFSIPENNNLKQQLQIEEDLIMNNAVSKVPNSKMYAKLKNLLQQNNIDLKALNLIEQTQVWTLDVNGSRTLKSIDKYKNIIQENRERLIEILEYGKKRDLEFKEWQEFDTRKKSKTIEEYGITEEKYDKLNRASNYRDKKQKEIRLAIQQIGNQESGYYDGKKSIRALKAENDGKFSLTEASKMLGVSTAQIKKYINPTEWHHSGGNMFNEIDYYDISKYIDVAEEGIDTYIDDIEYQETISNWLKMINSKKSIESFYNTNPTTNKDIRYSQNNDKWQKYLDKNLSLMPNATRTIIEKRNNAIANDSLVKFEENRRKKQQQENATEEKVANVLIESPKASETFKEKTKNVWEKIKREILDTGDRINTIGKKTDNPKLYQLYNNAKQSWAIINDMLGNKQSDLLGNTIGKSLKDIIEPIREKGDTYYQDFSNYLYHKHNIDRMSIEQRNMANMKNKPVFSENVTSLTSQNEVNKLDEQYPEFKELSKEIYNWNDNLMQYRIDTGLITQEQADYMKELYPHYVPTYRDLSSTKGAIVNGNVVSVSDTIKKATGSTKDILPLHEQMARQLAQTIQAGKRNLLGMEMYNTWLNNQDMLSSDIREVSIEQSNINEITDEIDNNETIPQMQNEFVFYKDGEKVTLQVSDGVFEGIKDISAKAEDSAIAKACETWNNVFKKSVTAWNPLFLIKNHLRDLQDAGLYTDDMGKFYSKYPKAIKEMFTNSEMWQRYQALGGQGASFFDYNEGYKTKSKNKGKRAVKKVGDFIENSNYVVEQLPRFTEFLNAMEGKELTYDNLMEGMLKAADITVNFGRSGSLVRVLNKSYVPFINPSIQGLDKAFRTIKDGTASFENAYKLAGKALILGIAPTLFNALLLSDDDDYQNLSEDVKDSYYLIPIGDGRYISIPKGRLLSIIGSVVRRPMDAITGKDVGNISDWFKFAGNQIGPVNPITNNIFAPALAVANNKTWYGSPIVNETLEQYKPRQQYDEKTSEIAKGIGGALNVSPKKVDYFIDATTGVFGDLLLPLTTKQAETGFLSKGFIRDSVTSNDLSTNFYNKIDELTKDKNDTKSKTNAESEYGLMYLNDMKKKLVYIVI